MTDKNLVSFSKEIFIYVCIPIRVIIALLFMFSFFDKKTYPVISMILGLIIIELLYIVHKSQNVIPLNIYRNIIIYIVCIILMVYKKSIPPYAIGALILSDAMYSLTSLART